MDKQWTDTLEIMVQINGSGSPTYAHVETRMESVNYLRFDLYESNLYKVDVLNNAGNMDTFAKYQNVVKANLMDKLSSYSSGGTAAANVAVYDTWARRVDESYIACRLLGSSIGNFSGPFSHSVTHYGSWDSNATAGGTKYGKWFYQWTYVDLEDTTGGSRINNVSGTPVYTDLRTGLNNIMLGMRTHTMTATEKDAIHLGLRQVLYFWLDRRMSTSQDTTYKGKWINALGGAWDGADNTKLGVDY